MQEKKIHALIDNQGRTIKGLMQETGHTWNTIKDVLDRLLKQGKIQEKKTLTKTKGRIHKINLYYRR